MGSVEYSPGYAYYLNNAMVNELMEYLDLPKHELEDLKFLLSDDDHSLWESTYELLAYDVVIGENELGVDHGGITVFNYPLDSLNDVSLEEYAVIKYDNRADFFNEQERGVKALDNLKLFIEFFHKQIYDLAYGEDCNSVTMSYMKGLHEGYINFVFNQGC